jgi:aminoglycoside phosphotransferase (APT) family kinase protein
MVMSADVERTADETGARHVVQFVEEHVGGTITALERIPRWRAGWYLTLDRDGTLIELYARGARGPDFASPFDLDHEARVHDLLETHGVPVPHVYGLVEGAPRTLVMARVPGQQGLALASDDATRRRLMSTYVEHLVHVHRIPHDELRSAGFRVPTDRVGTAMSEVFRNVEAKYLALDRRDPLIEFLRAWLWRNIPARTRPAFVTWDSAQFLHHDGALTALIDFELAHVGDAYMDLAAMRTRDSIEPLGDLQVTFAQYANLVGEAIDCDDLRFYEIAQLTVTLMLQFPVLVDPDPQSDYVTHLTWYTDSGRYALDILAERLGVELDRIEVPAPAPSAAHTRLRHLVRSLRTLARSEPKSDLTRYGIAVDPTIGEPHQAPAPVDEFVGWRARCAYRLARHLQRVDEIGAVLAADDRHDVARLVGTAVDDDAVADDALLAYIDGAGADRDVELLRLFSARLQRQHMTLGPADSLIVRHRPLQPLPDRASAHAPHTAPASST